MDRATYIIQRMKKTVTWPTGTRRVYPVLGLHTFPHAPSQQTPYHSIVRKHSMCTTRCLAIYKLMLRLQIQRRLALMLLGRLLFCCRSKTVPRALQTHHTHRLFELHSGLFYIVSAGAPREGAQLLGSGMYKYVASQCYNTAQVS